DDPPPPRLAPRHPRRRRRHGDRSRCRRRRRAGAPERSERLRHLQLLGRPGGTGGVRVGGGRVRDSPAGRRRRDRPRPERRRLLRPADDDLRRRQPARRLPDQLPPLRPVRRPRRAGAARPAAARKRGGASRGLLPAAAGGVHLRRRADVRPPEHLQPGRLLQPRPLRRRRRAPPDRGLDLGAVPGGRQGADQGQQRRRNHRPARPRRREQPDPLHPLHLAGGGRTGRRPRPPDPAHDRHPRGAGRHPVLHRPEPGPPRRPDRAGGAGRERRGPLRERDDGDAAPEPAVGAEPPGDPGLHLGRRSTPGRAGGTGRHPPLRRLLPRRRLRERRGRLGLHRVRQRPPGAADRRHDGADRPVLAGGRRVARLPRDAGRGRLRHATRPLQPAGQLPGLPRHNPPDPPRPLDLDLAGGGGRLQHHPRPRLLRRDPDRRRDPPRPATERGRLPPGRGRGGAL
ncbi:MAG: ABC transporter, substrate-binding protein (cluster 1, maltose/g3p/polyamine/iron), partial [uncultured Thermomicrobiales bacterium]